LIDFEKHESALLLWAFSLISSKTRPSSLPFFLCIFYLLGVAFRVCFLSLSFFSWISASLGCPLAFLLPIGQNSQHFFFCCFGVAVPRVREKKRFCSLAFAVRTSPFCKGHKDTAETHHEKKSKKKARKKREHSSTKARKKRKAASRGP
jgi:hypothetical protein